MKKYLSFFRLRFAMGLQYRAAAFGGIATQFTWGAMEIMIFRAFYRSDASAFPMSFSATASYLWLQQAFLAFFATWMMDGDIFDSIVNGDVAYELCRPVSIYNMWFSKGLSTRLSRAVLRCFPILTVAALLPQPYGLNAPASPMHFVLFLLTLILGLLMTVSLCVLICILAFFTISPMGLQMVFTSMTDFFAGALIPLPFFPENVQRVMELLPFAAMQNVPLRIYGGSMSCYEMQKAVFLQIFWLTAITFTGKMLCRLAAIRITVQGG